MLNYNEAKKVAIKLKDLGIDNANIIVKGPGSGREAIIRAIMDNGIKINLIKDKTPIPHNGCKPLTRLRKK